MKRKLRLALHFLNYKKFQSLLLYLSMLGMYIYTYLSHLDTKYIVDELFLGIGNDPLSQVLFTFFRIHLTAILLTYFHQYISKRNSQTIGHRFRGELLAKLSQRAGNRESGITYGDFETLSQSAIQAMDHSTYCFIEALLIAPLAMIIGLRYIVKLNLLLLGPVLLELIFVSLIVSQGSRYRERTSKIQLQSNGAISHSYPL